jgi:hypothetical protein
MDEERNGSSSPYNFYEDEDEERAPATAAAKPDARVVQSIYALVVDIVAKELRTDEHED